MYSNQGSSSAALWAQADKILVDEDSSGVEQLGEESEQGSSYYVPPPNSSGDQFMFGGNNNNSLARTTGH